MEYDEILESRLSVMTRRLEAVEQQLFVLSRGGTLTIKRRKRDLTPEERAAIRARLVAGQQKKQQEREAQIVAGATTQTKKQKAAKKKEAANEG